MVFFELNLTKSMFGKDERSLLVADLGSLTAKWAAACNFKGT